MRRPTLGDGLAKQPFGARHGKQRADAHTSSRLAKDSDVVGVAAEGGDILLYPLEGCDLIEQAEVGGSLTQIEEAIGADTVIDGHAYDAIAGEPDAIIHGHRRRSELKGAARNPDHHRLPGRPQVSGPDIEV